VLEVEQLGGVACHTGHESCFYQKLDRTDWLETDAIKINPDDMYKK